MGDVNGLSVSPKRGIQHREIWLGPRNYLIQELSIYPKVCIERDVHEL
jgi:hypothetical protein